MIVMSKAMGKIGASILLNGVLEVSVVPHEIQSVVYRAESPQAVH